VKLLFDENLSPKLAAALAGIFPESGHVHHVGLGGGSDDEVWEYARQHDFTLVSKDSDFHEKSILRGCPPKVIWIKRGNCTTNQIETIIRSHTEQIEILFRDPEATFLILL